MVLRNPALVVALAAGGNTDRLDGDLGLLGSFGGALGSREKSLDPSLVDKVQCASKDAAKDKVEEDTVICK